MSKLEFRTLRSDEISVRVARVTEKGVQLLLYKDARCDMAILDETVGRENWQREHYECKHNLFCKVGIYTESHGWVDKSDCGAESNTEKEKGEASDSFKRACVNWGIGRELYTAPFIWVFANKCTIETDKGKTVCKSKFAVQKIAYNDKKEIIGLAIMREKNAQINEKAETKVFVWQKEQQNGA